MQQLVVAAGGRLHQHLPDLLGHNRHSPAPGVYGELEARLTPGSRIAALLGESAVVHCHHHQGVADPGTLEVTARTPDGLPEAVEDPDRAFVLGVQWHPEVTRDEQLFGALVAAARQRAAVAG
jgi:putative glutamine amidotransferase